MALTYKQEYMLLIARGFYWPGDRYKNKKNIKPCIADNNQQYERYMKIMACM